MLLCFQVPVDPDTVLEKLKIINAIEKQEYSVEMPVQPAAFDHTEFVQKREVTRHDEVLKVGKKVKLLEDTFIQKIGSKSKILPDEYNVIRYEPTKDLYVLKACVPKDDDQRKDDEIYVPSWRLVEKLPNPDEELEDEEVLDALIYVVFIPKLCSPCWSVSLPLLTAGVFFVPRKVVGVVSDSEYHYLK